MIEIPFFLAELLFAAGWILYRAAVFVKRRRVDWKREALLLLMYVNLAVLIRLTFFPMSRVQGRVQPLVFDAAEAFPFRINPIPFVNLFNYTRRGDLLLNLLGNVGMFVPTGIVLPILYRRLNSFPKTVAAGALISLCIEFLQLPFVSRVSDIDDLILNTCGVALGYAVYAPFKIARNKVRKN